MEKPKIVFYGNCQVGGLSNIFCKHPFLAERFDVIDANEYNLPTQGYKAITSFLCDAEQHSKDDLEKALNSADILIFQSLDNIQDRPEYITSDYIYERFKGIKICIPSFWYSGYFGFPHAFPMLDFFVWMELKNFSEEMALDFLVNSEIPNAESVYKYYHKDSIDNLIRRSEEQSKKYNYICIIDWLKNNHKKKLLAYNHSHPTFHFYEFITNRILMQILDGNHKINLAGFDFVHGGPDGYFNPFKIKTFKKVFNDIPILDDYTKQYDRWHTYQSNDIDTFVKIGMEKAAKHIKNDELNLTVFKSLSIIKK